MTRRIDDGTGHFDELPGHGTYHGGSTTVPSAGVGYAHSAIYHDFDGSGTAALYVNTGTGKDAAPTFDRVVLESEFDAVATAALRAHAIPLNEFRIWDDFDAFLPETAGTDDLGFTEGTFGTSAPVITSGVVSAATATRYGRVQYPVPPDYVAGEAITLAVTWDEVQEAEASATIDAQVYRTAAASTDICATAAASMQLLDTGTTTFTITPTNVAAGDILDLRLAIALDDTAGNNAEYTISKVTLNFTTQQ